MIYSQIESLNFLRIIKNVLEMLIFQKNLFFSYLICFFPIPNFSLIP